MGAPNDMEDVVVVERQVPLHVPRTVLDDIVLVALERRAVRRVEILRAKRRIRRWWVGGGGGGAAQGKPTRCQPRQSLASMWSVTGLHMQSMEVTEASSTPSSLLLTPWVLSRSHTCRAGAVLASIWSASGEPESTMRG